MTEYTRVNPENYDFDSAPVFRKTAALPIDNVVIAQGGEEIKTMQPDGNGGQFVETVKTANEGDAIVKRDADDVYIIDAAKFPKLYEVNPENPDQYRSTNVGRAILMEQDIVITAPWGEDQQIKSGGILFRSNASPDVYGNQKHSFEGDFAREGVDGSLMPLTAPLQEQQQWAKELGEVAHLRDINRRIEIASAEAAARPSAVATPPEDFDMG
jgi:hypothetical protein